MKRGDGWLGRWGCNSLVIYHVVNEETGFLSMGGKGFSVPLFLLLIFMPFSLVDTSGCALNLPQSPLAVLEVSSLIRDTGHRRHWGIPVAKGRECGMTTLSSSQGSGCLAGLCGVFRQAGYSTLAPESRFSETIVCLPYSRSCCPGLLFISEFRSCFNVPLISRSWLWRGSSNRMLESMP